MSKIVTFEQAERLERLGFDESISHYYELEDGEWGITNTLDKDFKYFFIRYPDERSIIRLAPTVHEALDYIREEKGIACGVHPYAIYEDMTDGDQHFVKWGYKYVAFQGLSEWQNMNKDVFGTHTLAESALLDAVLTYLENK